MPNLLSLPRELRDDIYRKILDLPTNPEPEPSLAQGITSLRLSDAPAASGKYVSKRTRVVRPTPPSAGTETEDAAAASSNDALPPAPPTFDARGMEVLPDYYDGEESVRYPPAPTTNVTGLLSTSSQLRSEVLAAVRRAKMRYRIVLSYRDDKERVYPTWVHLPAFSDTVDTLDVDMRVRPKRSATLCSANLDDGGDDDDWDDRQGDLVKGTLGLLQRFLERGAHFLDGKRRRPMRVGHLRARWRMVRGRGVGDGPGYTLTAEGAGEMFEFFDGWLAGVNEEVSLGPWSRRGEDEFFMFVAGSVARFTLAVEVDAEPEGEPEPGKKGKTRWMESSWALGEATAKRKERLEKMRGDEEYERVTER